MKITRKRLKQLINESIAELNGDVEEACGAGSHARPKRKVAVIQLEEEDELDEAAYGDDGEAVGERGRHQDLEEIGIGSGAGMPTGGKVVDLEENFDLRQFVGDVIQGLLNEKDDKKEKKKDDFFGDIARETEKYGQPGVIKKNNLKKKKKIREEESLDEQEYQRGGYFPKRGEEKIVQKPTMPGKGEKLYSNPADDVAKRIRDAMKRKKQAQPNESLELDETDTYAHHELDHLLGLK